jgi:hypothetical protein
MSQSFAAVVVVGLAIFGLAFIANEASLDFSRDQPADSLEMYSRNIGTIGSAESDLRTVSFGSFTVGECKGEVTAAREEQLTVSNRLLSSDTYSFEYSAVQPDAGKVSFEVLGKEGYGGVYVDVNGRRVFQEPLVQGGTPEIEIPASALKNGRNSIEIGTTKGGVFQSSRYVLEDFQTTVTDRKFNDQVDSFRIYDYELRNFVAGNLSFRIGESVMTSPLNIDVNGEQVYSLSRVRGAETVEINPQNANLGVGFNTVRFGTEGDASYTVQDAQLAVRYVGRTTRAEYADSFTLDRNELSYVQRNDTREQVSFSYETLVGSPGQINVTINGESKVFTPRIGQNSYRVDASVFEEENNVLVSGEGAFRINSISASSELTGE